MMEVVFFLVLGCAAILIFAFMMIFHVATFVLLLMNNVEITEEFERISYELYPLQDLNLKRVSMKEKIKVIEEMAEDRKIKRHPKTLLFLLRNRRIWFIGYFSFAFILLISFLFSIFVMKGEPIVL